MTNPFKGSKTLVTLFSVVTPGVDYRPAELWVNVVKMREEIKNEQYVLTVVAIFDQLLQEQAQEG